MSRRFNQQYADPNGTIIEKPGIGILFAAGTTVPADTTAGFSPGCLYHDTDAAAGSTLFVNEGTATSSDFNAIVVVGGTISALTITTLTATTIAGTVAFTGRVTTTDGVSSGTARVVGGLAYSNTAASTAVTGTSAETVFDQSYTIPANTLKAGTVVKIRAQGIATGTTSTDAVAYKLYIGGSGGTALISAASTDATNNDTFQMEATLICRTAGTTGTFVATGTYKVSSAEGTMTVKDDITASTTINTTANQAVVVSAQWNTTNGTNSCRLDMLTVEIY